MMNPIHVLKVMLGIEPSCQKVNRFLADYMEGELPAETRRKFDVHLQKCPQCSTYFDQYRTTVDLIRQDDVPVPDELVEHTLAFLRSRANGSE